LSPKLTTNKGCAETGDNPQFAIGESILVSVRIDSSLPQASATIYDYAPNQSTVVISLGRIPTNTTTSFGARVGGPAGTEQLVLSASAAGAQTQTQACSFTVVGTTVPTGTRTPKPTATPIASVTRSATPVADLSGQIATNRGCRETGDPAVFSIGEQVFITFRIDSATAPRANASIVDSRPNGVQTILSLGSVPTGVPLSFAGQVGPPPGVHTLQLRSGGLSGGARLATCSFTVSDGVPPTTRTATRTTTPTHPPTPTRTRIPTRTATRPSATCAGACAQPGLVSLNDLLTVIEIANGKQPLSACPSADVNSDGQVSLDEVLQAVNNALDGCGD
jgi:hypothetical protein